MTHDIDHSRCSELLGRYHDGQLDGPEAAAVRAHLEGCTECTHELAALRALRAPAAGLRPDERDRLRRAVARDVGTPPARVLELPERPGPARWKARAAALLGAAATVAVLAVGVMMGRGPVGGGEDSGAAGGGVAQEAAVPDGPRPVFEAAAGASVAAEAEDVAEPRGGEVQNGSDEATAAGRVSALPPGAVTRAELHGLGVRGGPFRAFAGAYTAPFDPAMQAAFVDDLASAAPGELEGQVRECTEEMIADNNRILPAYGAERVFRNDSVLVLGFVTATHAEGPVDGFLFVLWPKGSCAVPTTSVGGQIVR